MQNGAASDSPRRWRGPTRARAPAMPRRHSRASVGRDPVRRGLRRPAVQLQLRDLDEGAARKTSRRTEDESPAEIRQQVEDSQLQRDERRLLPVRRRARPGASSRLATAARRTRGESPPASAGAEPRRRRGASRRGRRRRILRRDRHASDTPSDRPRKRTKTSSQRTAVCSHPVLGHPNCAISHASISRGGRPRVRPRGRRGTTPRRRGRCRARRPAVLPTARRGRSRARASARQARRPTASTHPKRRTAATAVSADAASMATFDSGIGQQQPVQPGEHRVAGGQPAGNRDQACGHLVVPPVRGAAPTVSVCGSLEAVASGTYIAEICAGIALNTPGVVTFSR